MITILQVARLRMSSMKLTATNAATYIDEVLSFTKKYWVPILAVFVFLIGVCVGHRKALPAATVIPPIVTVRPVNFVDEFDKSKEQAYDKINCMDINQLIADVCPRIK